MRGSGSSERDAYAPLLIWLTTSQHFAEPNFSDTPDSNSPAFHVNWHQWNP